MARQNDAPESGWVLVDIVIAAMAHLPALAHKPSRNFAAVRLKRRFWYGWPPVLCANICAFETVSSTRHAFTIPVLSDPSSRAYDQAEVHMAPLSVALSLCQHTPNKRRHHPVVAGFDEQAIGFCRAPYMTFTVRKKIPDPIRLTALETPALPSSPTQSASVARSRLTPSPA